MDWNSWANWPGQAKTELLFWCQWEVRHNRMFPLVEYFGCLVKIWAKWIEETLRVILDVVAEEGLELPRVSGLVLDMAVAGWGMPGAGWTGITLRCNSLWVILVSPLQNFWTDQLSLLNSLNNQFLAVRVSAKRSFWLFGQIKDKIAALIHGCICTCAKFPSEWFRKNIPTGKEHLRPSLPGRFQLWEYTYWVGIFFGTEIFEGNIPTGWGHSWGIYPPKNGAREFTYA